MYKPPPDKDVSTQIHKHLLAGSDKEDTIHHAGSVLN